MFFYGNAKDLILSLFIPFSENGKLIHNAFMSVTIIREWNLLDVLMSESVEYRLKILIHRTRITRIHWPISWTTSYRRDFLVGSLEFQQFCFYFLIHYVIDEKVWNLHHRWMLFRGTSGIFLQNFPSIPRSKNEVWSRKSLSFGTFYLEKCDFELY